MAARIFCLCLLLISFAAGLVPDPVPSSPPSLLQTKQTRDGDMERKDDGIFDAAKNAAKSLLHGAEKVVGGIVNAFSDKDKQQLNPQAAIEDCVCCKYVWSQVEMDVGNSQLEQTVYNSFYSNALQAQQTTIFYPCVQTMFDCIDDMISDYMSGFTVNQLCENSLLCRDD